VQVGGEQRVVVVGGIRHGDCGLRP
jgi:hypothetical protein